MTLAAEHGASRKNLKLSRRSAAAAGIVAIAGLSRSSTAGRAFSTPDRPPVQDPPVKEDTETKLKLEQAVAKSSKPTVAGASQPPKPVSLAEEAAAAARAFSRAGQLASGGRKSAPAAASTAWRRMLGCFGAAFGIQAAKKRSRGSATQPEVQPVTSDSGGKRYAPTDAGTVRDALKRFDLPFYATEAKEVFMPVYCLQISGNLREGAKDDIEASMATLQNVLEETLGMPLRLSLTRMEEDGSRYDLMVRKVYEPSTGTDVLTSVASFLITLGCLEGIGSLRQFQPLGAVTSLGSALPIECILAALAAGELSRLLVAASQGLTLRPPVFLPSPQLGVAGVFGEEVDTSTRSQRLTLAMVSPMVMAMVSSVFFGLYLLSDVSANEVLLSARGALTTLLVFLPLQCDPFLWAASQCLLMASFALLPHSPYGTAAWEALCGREKSSELAKVSSYFFPVVGLAATYLAGAGWANIHTWWSFLMINAAPQSTALVKEEVSEVPMPAKVFSLFVLVLAMIIALPIPPEAVGLTNPRSVIEVLSFV
mmetsp:Transcript_44123/g.104415  ORF Transcript_44123/g.104415 Transcript_44123/m.104415 type:complete len:539 (-) Transcript_44123:228-1844(-)|eukprot:CAMPEP_0178405532 /NCGR_PEP_ID=MMETSP0689_2-20121128/18448_1 /TAXON_ID=160604 /ORGANISM="Amphidinium massartii, Strain CS-259" /LENGTH=538 /DNA_ID=CAMNT_0020026551 /DNA_START=106 /DNA_END=1722 /DNA_ORIENTATION=+